MASEAIDPFVMLSKLVGPLEGIATAVTAIASNSDSVKLKTQRDEMAALAAMGSRLLTEGAIMLDKALNLENQFDKARELRSLVHALSQYSERVKPPVFDD